MHRIHKRVHSQTNWIVKFKTREAKKRNWISVFVFFHRTMISWNVASMSTLKNSKGWSRQTWQTEQLRSQRKFFIFLVYLDFGMTFRQPCRMKWKWLKCRRFFPSFLFGLFQIYFFCPLNWLNELKCTFVQISMTNHSKEIKTKKNVHVVYYIHMSDKVRNNSILFSFSFWIRNKR